MRRATHEHDGRRYANPPGMSGVDATLWRGLVWRGARDVVRDPLDADEHCSCYGHVEGKERRWYMVARRPAAAHGRLMDERDRWWRWGYIDRVCEFARKKCLCLPVIEFE